jgi:hypothetical protein
MFLSLTSEAISCACGINDLIYLPRRLLYGGVIVEEEDRSTSAECDEKIRHTALQSNVFRGNSHLIVRVCRQVCDARELSFIRSEEGQLA